MTFFQTKIRLDEGLTKNRSQQRQNRFACPGKENTNNFLVKPNER